MADQWRGDCLGFLGNPYVETPNLDSLFSKGTAFTQAYSAVPSCIAARAALLTGLSQKSHGRVGYQDAVPWDYAETLPGLLAEAGYHTHCAGKMHVYPPRNLMGFHSVDLHDGYLHIERCSSSAYNLVDDYLPWLREHCGVDADITDAGVGCNGYSVSPWPYEERYHPTNWVTNKAIDFLRRRDSRKPFFLKASYHRPHPPLDPPKSYLDRYLRKDIPPPVIGDWAQENSIPANRGLDSPVPNNPAQIDLARKAYYAQLTHIDCQINRLIHALKEQKILDNTLFIFTSDHGEMLYDHNMVAKSFGYDAAARIPFLVRFPENWSPSKVSRIDAPVELRDVLPTFLDAAGVKIPDSIEGQSVLPWCRGEKPEWREYIHGEHSRWENSNHWITNGKEMYTWNSQNGVEQYFDIVNDKCNMHDLSKEKGDRVAYLRKLLIAELEGREEGYVSNGKLIVGREAQNILRERIPVMETI
jgi:arylsulfatase A-like enzyme